MGERALIKNSTDNIQAKRRAIQIRREKEYAMAQYQRMANKARKTKKAPLKAKDSASINHAIFFTICLGVGSIVLPQLGALAIIFSIIILGKALGEQFEWFKKAELNSLQKGNLPDDKMLKMVGPEVVKLSSKKRIELPLAKTKKGLSFSDENGATVTQFDWRQLTQ